MILIQRLRNARRELLNRYYGIFGRDYQPEKWCFIVGCYNSGTTLLHAMLAQHSDVASMSNEGQIFTDQLLWPKAVGLNRKWALKPELFQMDETSSIANADRIKRQWGPRMNKKGKTVCVEKTTINSARSRWLQAHFPNAHFIGIVRNGYAVAEGIRRKGNHPVSVAAEQWKRSNQIMLEDFECLERKLLIRYEDLTSDPIATVSQVLAFLGLTDVSAELTDRSWSIHERSMTIQNLNRESFSRLSEKDKAEISHVAGELLDKFRYRPETEDEYK